MSLLEIASITTTGLTFFIAFVLMAS